MTKEEKIKKLRKIAANIIEKEEGKGYDAKIGFMDDEGMEGVGIFDLQPSGIPSIDTYLGGGFPIGCHIQLAGDPDVGKTTIALNLIASAQRKGLVCGFADFEGKFDKAWAQKQGVNTDDLVFGRFDIAEAGFEFIKDASGVADLIIVDSVTALASRQMVQTKAGKEKDFDDMTMGVMAKLLNQYFRIAQPTVVKNKCTVVMINHMYETLDGYNGKATGGGRGIKHFEILELWATKSQLEKELREEFGEQAFQLRLSTKKGHYTGAPAEGSSMQTVFFKNQGFDFEYEAVMNAINSGKIYNDGSKSYFIDSQGEIHENRGFKPFTVYRWMKDSKLIDDLTGKKPETTDTVVEPKSKKKAKK